MRLMRGGSLATVLEQHALSPGADHHDGRSARQRAADGTSLGRRPPRHQAGQHPHRRRGQRLPVGLRDRRRGGRCGRRTLRLSGRRSTLRTRRPSSSIAARSTATSDIYSLGVVVAQALTGLRGDVAQIRGALPPPVLRVIDRATDDDATSRYRSIDAFTTDLRETLIGTTGADNGARSAARRALTPSLDVAGRQPVQGTAGVRRHRRRRLPRQGTTRRTARRPARPAGNPRPVLRRGRSERQRQVERREGRAARRDPSRRGPHVGFVVHDRDDPGAPPVRGARGRAARASPSIRPPRCSNSWRATTGCRARLSRVLPNDGSQLLLVDRPVRGAVHAGRRGHRGPVPRQLS